MSHSTRGGGKGGALGIALRPNSLFGIEEEVRREGIGRIEHMRRR